REVVEGETQRDGAPDPMCRAHAPRHSVDEAEQDGFDVLARATPAAEGALRADRAAPASRCDATRVAVVRERVQLPTGRATEDRDERALGHLRDLTDRRDAELPQPGGGDVADAPQPFD